MLIQNNTLLSDDGTPVSFEQTPNSSAMIDRRYLVIHYTAGRTAESSIAWFKNRDAKASSHLVIGRDGSITQLVKFNRASWHAGKSRWKDLKGLNGHSIGIELDNAGKLTRQDDHWLSWFGGKYESDDVIEAVHKNETGMAGWHTFTPAQMEAAVAVSSVLVSKYQLEDILGHEDISPGRKVDPGPAFPMGSFRSKVLGRRENEDAHYQTTTTLNIRSGPGAAYTTIEGGPLPEGTEVATLAAQGSWRLVDVIPTVNDVADLQGWVHGRYLEDV